MESNEELVQLIRREIEQSDVKAISFRQFMELCLYAPELGYYTGTRSKVGKKGDFYTSSSIGSLLGEILACHMVKKLTENTSESYEIVEWGGGNGQLAQQILHKLQVDFSEFYRRLHFIEIERSEYHRELQKVNLQQHLDVISFWSPEQWKEQGKRTDTYIFSNELLDAFPVHRVRYKADLLYELFVGWDEAKQLFYECELPCENVQLLAYLKRDNIVLHEGQTAEINLAADEWLAETANWLEAGHLITIDYGDIASEIYATHRMHGTLLCYKDHQAYDNPYIHVGEQDITAHINFSACIQSGSKAGIQESKLLTQKEFLVQEGILELLQNDNSRDPFGPVAKRNRAIRQLLLGDQMSELFKVLHLTKR
ncbi:class I SAM-dependent methyltransferase [Paenibacillus psychroresistens]|nr:SAM-dependent methyltransferase [Paenibacillus psychroresistens]